MKRTPKLRKLAVKNSPKTPKLKNSKAKLLKERIKPEGKGELEVIFDKIRKKHEESQNRNKMLKPVSNSSEMKSESKSKLKEESESLRKSENKTKFEAIRRKYQNKTNKISTDATCSNDDHRKEIVKTALPSVVRSLGEFGKVDGKPNFHKKSNILREQDWVAFMSQPY